MIKYLLIMIVINFQTGQPRGSLISTDVITLELCQFQGEVSKETMNKRFKGKAKVEFVCMQYPEKSKSI